MEETIRDELADAHHLSSALSAVRLDIAKTQGIIQTLTSDLKRQLAVANELESLIAARECRLLQDKSRSRPTEPHYATVIKNARRFMVEEGRPLNRQEILAKMLDAGETLAVNDPPHFIGKTLWRSSQFVTLKEGYWPADLDLPENVTPKKSGHRASISDVPPPTGQKQF